MICNKIAFINGKGGCAKTTSIFHIAGCLAAAGEKVLVIDLDKQRNITDTLLMNDESAYDSYHSLTVLNWMMKKCNIREVVKMSYIVGVGERTAKYRNIDVLPSDVQLENEKFLKNVNIADSLNEFILEQGYTWVLIDMPPSNKSLNEICFAQMANYLVVPFSSDIYSVSGYGDLMDTVNHARELNDELHILGIYLSRYMENCAVDRYIREQLQGFGDIFIDVQIPLKADIREGVMFGRPISYYKKLSQSKTSFENLVKEIRRRIENIKNM